MRRLCVALSFACLATPAACTGNILDGPGGSVSDTDAGDRYLPDGARIEPDAPLQPPDGPVISTPDATPAPPDAGVPFLLQDSLRGSTTGNPIGGSFGPDGWTVTERTNRIWWALPRLATGSMEVTVTMSNANLVTNDNEMLAFYEAGYDIAEPINYSPEFRNNHYKIMLRIYGQAEIGREGLQKLMWGMCPSGAPGYDACTCSSFFEEPFGGNGSWDGTPQRLRIEWGGGHTRYLREGNLVHDIDWSQTGLEFGPQELHFSLGTSRPDAVGTADLPVGAVFADLVIEGVTGGQDSCP
jgi:hypothetical protein